MAGHRRVPALIISAVFIAGLSACATRKDGAAAAVVAEEPAPEHEKSLELGWQKLWADDFAGAASEFKKASAAPRYAHRALRGLALAQASMGELHASMDSAAGSIEADPSSVHAIALREFADGIADDGEASRILSTRMDMALMSARGSPWARRSGAENAIDILDTTIDPSKPGRYAAATFSSEAVAGKPGAWPGDYGKLRGVMGVIGDWEFLGPFPVTGRRGMERAFIDEATAGRGQGPAAFENGTGRGKIAWLKPAHADADGRIYPPEHSGGRDSVYYARSRLDNPAAGDYWLVLDRACAVNAWIDGKLILDDPVHRVGSGMHWLRIALPRGKPVLLLKIGDRDGASWIRASLMKADREEAFDRAYRATVEAMEAMGEIEAETADPVLARLSAGLEAENAGEKEFWLGLALSERGEAMAGLTALDRAERAMKRAPALYAYAKARCYETTGLEAEAQSIKAAQRRRGPAFAPFIEDEAGEALKQGRAAAARELLSGMQEKYRGSTSLERFTAERERADMDAGVLVGRMAKLPQTMESWSWISDAARNASYDEIARDAAGVLAANRAGRASSWRAYIESAMATGSLQENELDSALDSARASFPFDEGLARIALGMLDTKIALERRVRLSSDPKSATDAERKAQERQKALLKALSGINPADSSIRDRNRAESGLEALDTMKAGPDLLKELRAFRGDKNAVKGKDATIVLDERTYRFLPGGGFKIGFRGIIEIHSLFGADKERARDVSAMSRAGARLTIESAYALKADGSMAFADISDGRISYPGLSAGDCVFFSYSADGERPQAFSDEIWLDEDFFSDYPIAKKVVTILYSKGLEPAFMVHNDARKGIKADKGGYSAEFDSLSFAALKLVQHKPAEGVDPREYLPWIDVSSVKDWGAVSEWFADSNDGRAEASPYLRVKAEELTSGAATRAEKLRKLYDAATSASEAEGERDARELLIALSRSIGIDARFALCDSGSARSQALLPSDRFDRLLVAIPGGEFGSAGSPLLLDPGSEGMTFGEIPDALDGCSYIVSGDAKAALSKIPRGKRAPTTFFIAIKASASRDEARGAIVYHGDAAAGFRDIADSEDKDSVRDSLRALVSPGLPGVQVSGLDAIAVSSRQAAPIASFTASLPGSIRKEARGSFVIVPWPLPIARDAILAPLASMQDGRIVRTEDAGRIKQTVVIELPKGTRFLSLPPDARLEFSGSWVNISYRTDSLGRIICECEYALEGEILNEKNAAAYEEFARNFEAKQGETIPIIGP